MAVKVPTWELEAVDCSKNEFSPADQWMISTPPRKVALDKIQRREFPFTNRRIAILEASHYLSMNQAAAYARLFAAAPGLLAACRLALPHLVNEESADAVRAAIAKAEDC